MSRVGETRIKKGREQRLIEIEHQYFRERNYKIKRVWRDAKSGIDETEFEVW